jgi:hypothetical protein
MNFIKVIKQIPEEYFRRLHERFLKLQKEFGKRA